MEGGEEEGDEKASLLCSVLLHKWIEEGGGAALAARHSTAHCRSCWRCRLQAKHCVCAQMCASHPAHLLVAPTQPLTLPVLPALSYYLSTHSYYLSKHQVLVAERGPLVFVFNWHPHDDYEGLKIAAPEPGVL